MIVNVIQYLSLYVTANPKIATYSIFAISVAWYLVHYIIMQLNDRTYRGMRTFPARVSIKANNPQKTIITTLVAGMTEVTNNSCYVFDQKINIWQPFTVLPNKNIYAEAVEQRNTTPIIKVTPQEKIPYRESKKNRVKSVWMTQYIDSLFFINRLIPLKYRDLNKTKESIKRQFKHYEKEFESSMHIPFIASSIPEKIILYIITPTLALTLLRSGILQKKMISLKEIAIYAILFSLFNLYYLVDGANYSFYNGRYSKYLVLAFYSLGSVICICSILIFMSLF